MKRHERIWHHHADHIVSSIDKIERFKTHRAEVDPELYQDAIYRNLHTIGESADELPDWIKEEYPQIP